MWFYVPRPDRNTTSANQRAAELKSPNQGRSLGHYRLCEQIGAGGMGVVHRAQDERLKRDVAVKLLPVGALADTAARKHFRKEALALSRVNHPNVATIFDFDNANGQDFVVLELIPGETLENRVQRGKLSEAETLTLGLQICAGVAAAHEQGVIHRDLKPGNVRITPDGRAKVLDFGLARIIQPVGAVASTQSLTQHAPAGTLPYMSPEQMNGNEGDARSDIWSLGALLYECVSGRRAFPQASAAQIISAVLRCAVTPPRSVTPGVSPALEAVILKCLDIDPRRRYQSVRELEGDLDRLSTAGSRIHVRSRWHGRKLAALAVFIILIIAIGTYYRRRTTSVAGSIRSLAVLPLANLSGDPSQDYFADGLTEALITDLAEIHALKVISRTSVNQFRKSEESLPKIAQTLGVQGILEGSVQRAGSRVRVTAKLIYAPGDQPLWARTYESDVRDVLGVEDDLARRVAHEVKVQLTPQEQSALAANHTVNPEAHEAYLKGRYEWNRWTKQGLLKSIEFFREAIAKDPAYAEAWAGLSDSYDVLGDNGMMSGPEVLPKAKEAAERALAINANLAEPHVSMGGVYLHYEWNWSEAEKEFQRAIALNSNYAMAHLWYGYFLRIMGRFDESIAEMRTALSLDPLSPSVNESLAETYYDAGRHDEAEDQYRNLIEIEPAADVAYFKLGWVYSARGMYRQAYESIRKSLDLQRNTEMLADFDRTYAAAGFGAAYGGLERKHLAGLLKAYRSGAPTAYLVAFHYALLGDKEQTLRWLNTAYEQHDSQLIFINAVPAFTNMRSDPHFQELIRRLGLPR